MTFGELGRVGTECGGNCWGLGVGSKYGVRMADLGVALEILVSLRWGRAISGR